MDNMTVLSKNLFEQTKKVNSVDEAIEILLTYAQFRTLGDTLRKFAPAHDIKEFLVAGLRQWFPNDKPESIDRKVRNWLNGKTQSISKQDGYIISRVLQLSLEQTNEFLQYSTGEGIHWRDPEDIVWCYSIMHGLDPVQTKCLLERAKTELGFGAGTSGGSASTYTAEVYDKLLPVLYLEEDALLTFLKDERSKLGSLHNTAYLLFTQYMELLKRGYSDYGVEALFEDMTKEEKKKALGRVDGDIGPHKAEAIAVRDILETYLYRKLIPVQARGKAKTVEVFSAIQRSIRQNWPDEFSLSKMETRKLDVSRKTLILLFLATDGTDSDYDEYDELESGDDTFRSLYTRMDTMLSACGFPQLDPRNPFDWIILFCISSGDLWESDARLQEILTRMYPSASLPNT